MKTQNDNDQISQNYLESAGKLLRYYKSLGEGAIAQITDEQMHWTYNESSNSIAVIIRHIAGNSLSRWSDFLTSDGEKPWRNRDEEFEDPSASKLELLELWNKGWECLFNAIAQIKEEDLKRIVYIRNEGHTVLEAINRTLAHLPYHVGQIVFIAKTLTGNDWTTLSIAKGQSTGYNSGKFSDKKDIKFFTDGMKK